jgi:uncharacterized protein
MLAILSPAKDMNTSNRNNDFGIRATLPEYLNRAEIVIAALRKLNLEELSSLWAVNSKLFEQNLLRIHAWNVNHTPLNSQLAIHAYAGEAYRGLDAMDFDNVELLYSQSVLHILSAVYGVLRPLDLIQPYRLEMASKFQVQGTSNLNVFWGNYVIDTIHRSILQSPGEKVLVNLASAEYSSVIDFDNLRFPVITPVFKEDKGGQLKMVTVYAKKARGMMARFMIKEQLEKVEDLKAFSEAGYYFSNQLSDSRNLVFVR